MTSKALPIWIIGFLLFVIFALFSRTLELQHQQAQTERDYRAALKRVADVRAEAIVADNLAKSGNPQLRRQGPAYQPPSDITSYYEPSLSATDPLAAYEPRLNLQKPTAAEEPREN